MLRVVPERESVPRVTKLALVSGCIIKPDTVKVNRSFLTVLEWENSCCVYGQELLGRTVSHRQEEETFTSAGNIAKRFSKLSSTHSYIYKRQSCSKVNVSYFVVSAQIMQLIQLSS